MSFLRTPCDHISGLATTASFNEKNEKWLLSATILASSMAFIDATVVNVALPALQDALHASVSHIQWIIEAYSLTLAALLLVGGALGDIYGRRIIFLLGVLIFALSSIACGLAMTISQLIIARTIQGIGSAFLIPGSLALITAYIPPERRGQAIGTWAGFTSVTTAAGPVLGGWLIQHASWRWIFFLNLPLAVIVFIISILYICESKNSEQPHGLDLWGAFLVTIGLAAIVFGLLEWEKGQTLIIVAETIGVFALLGFFYVEAHTKFPMVPLEMFRSANFSGANLITFFLYFALYGVLFFLPLNLIQVQAYTATQAGAALLPLILLMFFLSRWSGGLVKRIGPKLPLIIGPAIAALGFCLFILSGIGHSYWTHFFPPILILGLGMAVSVAPLTTVVMSSVTLEHVGAASGINNAISRIAGLLAIAILGLVMTILFNQSLIKNLNTSSIPTSIQQEVMAERSQLAAIKNKNESVRPIVQESFLIGFHAVLQIAVVLALASSLSAYLFISKKLDGESNNQ